MIQGLTYKLILILISNDFLNQVYILRGYLSGGIQPTGGASARGNNDSTAFELAHIFTVDLDPVHARAGDVFFCREDLVEAQLGGGLSECIVFDFEQRPCPVIVLELAREKVLQELGDLPVPLVKLDFSIKQGPCSSGGI